MENRRERKTNARSEKKNTSTGAVMNYMDDNAQKLALPSCDIESISLTSITLWRYETHTAYLIAYGAALKRSSTYWRHEDMSPTCR
jgi:hypothetical protein